MKLHSLIHRARYTWRHMPRWAKIADMIIMSAIIAGLALWAIR